VVFNDALAARRAARAAGEPYIPDAAMSAALTACKGTPERAWLGEVSSAVLQQALADLKIGDVEVRWSRDLPAAPTPGTSTPVEAR
jgi:hypothetical protein